MAVVTAPTPDDIAALADDLREIAYEMVLYGKEGKRVLRPAADALVVLSARCEDLEAAVNFYAMSPHSQRRRIFPKVEPKRWSEHGGEG